MFLFSTIAPAAPAGSTIGTASAPIALTTENVYEQVVKLKLMLDKKNVPVTGRKLAVPPELHALLLQDQRFIGTGGLKAEEALINGLVGRLAGFDVYMSINVPAVTGANAHNCDPQHGRPLTQNKS